MLKIANLVYRIAGRTLFEDAGLTLSRGDRAGFVGRNGTGKSTLLRLIAGELQPDSGTIAVPKRWRIGMLAQEAPDGPRSLLETVLAADKERSRLLSAADAAADESSGEIHARLADIGAYGAPARAAGILAGLGFDAARQAQPCQEFSGGWRMRVGLAAVLFAEPDFLLLDEPTNHLDLEATLWLERYLQSYRGAMLLVSHDRDLLNNVVDRIVHLDQRKLAVYSGGYDVFERTRAMTLDHREKRRVKQIAERRHMQAFVDRFRYKASKARQAQSRLKAIERLEPIAEAALGRSIVFNFPAPEALAPPILALDEVAAGYTPGVPVLSRLTLRLDMDDRVALVGANGNGKSTLVRLLAGRLAPMSGEISRSPKLRVGYFAQHQTEELDVNATPVQLMERLAPTMSAEKRRAHLGRFVIGAELASTEVGSLSGGEKSRLLIALMSHASPHLLLLDEPTNHLDVDSREALIRSMNEFEGAIVLITHDPHLIRLAADRLWLVADGTCRTFDGDFEEYRRLVLEASREKGARDAPPANSQRRAARKAAAAARKAGAPLRKSAADAERRMADAQRMKAEIESRLADPALYHEAGSNSGQEVARLTVDLDRARRALASAEEEWLAAQQAVEQAAG
jgi:ATP-binding cassette subfamily F protein 3